MTVFIQKGDMPLSKLQAELRGWQVAEAEMAAAKVRPGDLMILANTPHASLPDRLVAILRDLPGSPETYQDYTTAWEVDNEINGANNLFNHQLAARDKALARLAQVRLAEGRAEVVEIQETGEFDPATGEPVLAPVVIAAAVDPLPAMVEVPAFDEVTGEPTGTVEVPNPAIVQDEQERAIAAGTLAALPQEVIDYAP